MGSQTVLSNNTACLVFLSPFTTVWTLCYIVHCLRFHLEACPWRRWCEGWVVRETCGGYAPLPRWRNATLKQSRRWTDFPSVCGCGFNEETKNKRREHGTFYLCLYITSPRLFLFHCRSEKKSNVNRGWNHAPPQHSVRHMMMWTSSFLNAARWNEKKGGQKERKHMEFDTSFG